MSAEPAGSAIRLVLPSHPQAVREALGTLFAATGLGDLSGTCRASAEIVLAEVLNNVAEHAYRGGEGLIEVTVRLDGTTMACRIVDHGTRMPEGCLPAGALPSLESVSGLPEGGFGWHLIRTLTDDLSYRRIRGRNELTFSLNNAQ